MSKTPEESKRIKNGLMVCSNSEETCEGCPYKPEKKEALACSSGIMKKEALEYINELEERINLMLIQMRGDCGCCAYKGRPSYKSPCTECLCGENRPKWEYEGLPDVKEKGDME